MYYLNHWTLSNTAFVTPAPGEAPVAGRDYVTFDIPDLEVGPSTNLTYTDVADASIGNSLEVVGNFTTNDHQNYFSMIIDDGTNRASIEIHNGYLADPTAQNEYGEPVTIPVANYSSDYQQESSQYDDLGHTDDHRYTITLKNGVFSVLFDTVEVYRREDTDASVESMLGVGIFSSQTGSIVLNLRYIKQAKGLYKYIKPSDVDFELQIDTVNTFDSVNLHTYTKESFEFVPDVLDDWDPVSFLNGGVLGNSEYTAGLVQAAAVHLPVRQPNDSYTFYYRVRFTGENYTSNWSNIYLTKRVKSDEISALDPNDNRKIALELTADSDKYQAISPTEPDLGILLPEIPTTNLLTFTIFNDSTYNVNVYSHFYNELTDTTVFYNPFEIQGNTIVNISYDEETNKWYLSNVHKEVSFVLPQNIQNLVFTGVYNYHIPALDFVYTKTYNSGNVADFVRANATEIDYAFNTLVNASKDIDSYKADRDQFNERWGNIFELDASLFKNSAERRDIFQCLVASLSGEMLRCKLSELIYDISGAKPKIIEYKDENFNILGDKNYYLFDTEHPTYFKKPFILYGGAPKAFSWQINVYDPYNLRYEQCLVKKIVEMFKPAYSYAVINFYDYEGVNYRKTYVYSYDNYVESAYNKA